MGRTRKKTGGTQWDLGAGGDQTPGRPAERNEGVHPRVQGWEALAAEAAERNEV